MKRYHALIGYGLSAALALGLSSCNKETSKEPDPIYISGTVKGENFQTNIINNDVYTFSLDMNHEFDHEFGILKFKCPQASTLDTLISPGDTVNVRLDMRSGYSGNKVARTNVTAINGKSIDFSCTF